MKTFAPLLLLAAALAAPAADPKDAKPAVAPPLPKPVVSADTLFPPTVLARGRGFEVNSKQLDEAFLNFRTAAASRGQQPPPEDKRVEVERKLLDRLVVVEVLKRKSTEADKAKGKASADKMLGDFLKQAGSPEGFRRQVEAMGMTPESFTAQFTERAIVEEVVNREVREKVPITPQQAQKYYDENPQRFEQPETVRAAHILLATRDLATNTELPPDKQKAQRALIDAVLKRVRAGEDFGKLAKEFSQDPGSKERGGEYVFPRGQMAMEFETAAFGMRPGQISDVVTTKFGFHIIKMLERNPAKKVEFDKVKERIRENLQQEEADKQLPEYLEKVKKEAGVEILDAKYK
ncbi:MAG: peptidylprolyl isomerase [Verrucomicrobia bacterium]|nr:peptidylprolyl isomerase [Verrucomicrobiota bacterium]